MKGLAALGAAGFIAAVGALWFLTNPAVVTVRASPMLLQSMARDLATLGQAIEQLKVSQQQMARDHVNAVDLLRASQEQMARVIEGFRGQGFRGQGFRAEPAAEAISASAAADCRPGAQAGADALTIPGVGHLTALAFTARRRPSRTRRFGRR